MRFIKRLARFSPFVLVSILFSNLVSAQSFRDSFGPFWDLIDYLFNYLPNNSASQGAYFKLLLWLLFFSLYVVLVGKLDIFKRAEQRKQGNIVAMILSLMTVLLMPNTILVAIFTSYAYLGAFVLTFLVPIILIWLAHETKECRLKAGSLLLGGIFLMAFTPVFWSEFTQPWTKTISSFMSIAGVGLFIYGIIAFLNCRKGPGPGGGTEPPPVGPKPPPDGEGGNTTNIAEGGDATATGGKAEIGDIKTGDVTIGDTRIQIDLTKLIEELKGDRTTIINEIKKINGELEYTLGEILKFHDGLNDKSSGLNEVIKTYSYIIKNFQELEEKLTNYSKILKPLKQGAKPEVLDSVKAALTKHLVGRDNAEKNDPIQNILALEKLDTYKTKIDGILGTLESQLDNLIIDAQRRLSRVESALHFRNYDSLEPVAQSLKNEVEHLKSAIIRLGRTERRQSRRIYQEINDHIGKLDKAGVRQTVGDVINYVNNYQSKSHITKENGKFVFTLGQAKSKISHVIGHIKDTLPHHVTIQQKMIDIREKRLPSEYKVSDEVIHNFRKVINEINQLNAQLETIISKISS